MSLNHQALAIAGAIATVLVSPLLINRGAIAQSSIRECLSEFVRQGVSPDKAADFPNPVGGGSPQAIQQCMENLLYRTEVQKPFPAWNCVPNDVNCKTVRVRTETSETAAVQACQNAR